MESGISITNLYHLFPFSRVIPGSEIILYGYGVMGRQYVEQIEKTGYCGIKYIVDKRYKELVGSPYEIRDPASIYMEADPTIVITTGRYAAEVVNELLRGGISEERIISENIELNAYSYERVAVSEDIREYLENLRALISVSDVKPSSGLIRVGAPNDGGYLMVDDFSKNGGIAYSFGINRDVSWDKAMADNGYDIYMYDHTIDALPEDNERFHWSKVGLASYSDRTHNLDTIGNLIRINGHTDTRDMILKMDIEGAEWDVFKHMDEDILSRFDQIVMELHGLHSFYMKDEIIHVLSKLNKSHACAHIHANNSAGLIYLDGVPYADCLEVTFVRRNNREFTTCGHSLPHKLDRPCDSARSEYILGDYYVVRTNGEEKPLSRRTHT